MRNVTISMDEATLAWVRIEAARAGKSVSRWIGDHLLSLNREHREKAAAAARIKTFLAGFPSIPLSENGKITIDRDEMYEQLFRRFDDAPLSAGPGGADEGQNMRGVAEPSHGEGSSDP